MLHHSKMKIQNVDLEPRMDTIKYLLSEDQMPTALYNIQADLSTPLRPVLLLGGLAYRSQCDCESALQSISNGTGLLGRGNAASKVANSKAFNFKFKAA